MKKTLLCVAVTSTFGASVSYAYSDHQRLIVSELSNATPGTTLIVHKIENDTDRYYTFDDNNQLTQINIQEIDGKKVVALDVKREIKNARLDMWQSGGYGLADEFQLNFSNDLTLNRDTNILNTYGAIYLNTAEFDLTLNFDKGQKLTVDAKPSEVGEGGIINAEDHSGNLNINGGLLYIFETKQDKSDCTDPVSGLQNESPGTVNIRNEAVLIQLTDSDSKQNKGIVALSSGGININTGSLTIEKSAQSANESDFYYGMTSQGKGDPIRIHANTVSISDSGCAVHASSSGQIDINADTVTIFNSSKQAVRSNSKGNIRITANTLALHDNTYAGFVTEGGQIIVNAREAYINSAYGDHEDLQPNEWTLWATGKDSSIVFNEIGNRKLNTSGYMKAKDFGAISLRAGSDSIMKHQAVIEENGVFNMTLLDHAVWHMPHDNTLTNLVFEDGGRVDFNHDYNLKENIPIFKNLTTASLSGNGGTLGLRIDLAKDADGALANDQIIVTGKAQGSHIADITINGRELVPEKLHSENWLVSQGAGSDLTILNQEGTNEFTGNGMVTTWALGFVADGDEAKLDTSEGLREIASATTGTDSGKWYLVRTDESLPDPQPDPDPDPDPDPKPEDPGEMQTLTNLGISATQAMSFAAELEDLRTRLGEIRYGAQEGAWVKAGYAKERAEGFRGRGFEQKTTDLHIGLDRLVSEDESSAWLVGGALRCAESDQEGFAAAAGGDGTLEQYSAKLYAAYMHESGSYADFVLQAGRYDQEVKGLANDKTGAFRADYTGYGFGAGVEVGHMFAFNETVDDRRWFDHAFFEPQLQLTYFRAQGEDYRTTTGMKVSQGDADFLTGRAGFVLGKKFGFGSAESLDRRFFQVGLKGGVKYEFLGDQTVRFTGVEGVTKKRDAEAFDGARWYYGITADWQMSEDFRAYANLEREEGDRYTKDFDVSVGVKYLF